MSTDPRAVPSGGAMPSESVNPPELTVRKRRLWFGCAGGAGAWIALGCLDILVTWRACMHQENFGIPREHPGAGWLILALALLLLATTIVAGAISYRNWRRLSQNNRMLDSQAVERGEFMAVVGVIVSITLGVGIVFLALPPLFLDLCWRAK